MLWITTWLWGSRYRGGYVDKLMAGVRRHLKQDYQFVVISDDYRQPSIESPDAVLVIPSEDRHLLQCKGCLARLRTFDPEWQDEQGFAPGDRIVCLDLDMVITGELDPLFDRDDDFTILQGVNATNPNPYNGSAWMLKAGTHADVWTDFSEEEAEKLPHFLLSDDQDWMHHKIPNAAAWGPKDGVYGFQKPGWPKGDALPPNARIVAFPGKRDPIQFTHLKWIQKHWGA